MIQVMLNDSRVVTFAENLGYYNVQQAEGMAMSNDSNVLSSRQTERTFKNLRVQKTVPIMEGLKRATVSWEEENIVMYRRSSGYILQFFKKGMNEE